MVLTHPLLPAADSGKWCSITGKPTSSL